MNSGGKTFSCFQSTLLNFAKFAESNSKEGAADCCAHSYHSQNRRAGFVVVVFGNPVCFVARLFPYCN